MTTPYTHVLDVAKEAQLPEKGIFSRTIYNDDRIKAVVFGFGEGEEGASPVKTSLERRCQCVGRRIVSKSEAFSIPLTVCGAPLGR